MFKIAICDDERSTCSELKDMLMEISEESEEVFNIDLWYSGEELYRYIKDGGEIDLLFLDIELSDMNGLFVGDAIRNYFGNFKMAIVFISHKQFYALELFVLHPLNFLVKPIKNEDLIKTMKLFYQGFKNRSDIFEYKISKTNYRIRTNRIIYFVSYGRKVRIITEEETIEFYGKLKQIYKVLPEYFIQIQNSYIINQNFVSNYQHDKVRMSDNQVIMISRDFSKEARMKLLTYSFNYY